MLRVLDLYAGTGSATEGFQRRGHDVRYVELDEGLAADLAARYGSKRVHRIDARQVAKDPSRVLGSWKPDIIWASPPCNAFSMAGKSSARLGEKSARWTFRPKADPHPFYGPRVPKDQVAREGVALVLAALEAIKKLEPRYWWLENPMGGLKTLGFMRRVGEPAIVTYCQYGERRMKATTLWGEWPESWKPRPRCKNGDECHEASPRGSKTGTQGLPPRDRGRIPRRLSDSIAKACEREA